MGSLGTAIFDFALYAYPLYQTNKLNILADHKNDDDEGDTTELTHWLRFWTVVAGLSVVEDIGINTLPGYYFLKAGVVLGMYSDIHSNFLNGMVLRKAFVKYNETSDKAVQWWNENGKPQITKMDDKSGGWISTIRQKATSVIWWNRPHED